MRGNAKVTTVLPAIDKLRAAGMVLESHDPSVLRTVDPVCILGSEKAARLMDGEGNSLHRGEKTA